MSPVVVSPSIDCSRSTRIGMGASVSGPLLMTITASGLAVFRKPIVSVILRTFTGERIYVGGEVGRPGMVELKAGMTALQAVINAGGFKETAKPDGVLVIRNGTTDAPIPIRVDLEETIDGANTLGDIQLQSFDIVYVPKTWIANANVFVDQYIKGLLMFRGWSINLNPFLEPFYPSRDEETGDRTF